MRWLLCAAVLAMGGCASVAGGPGRAVLSVEAEAGRHLAQRACSGCHAMTPDRPSIDHRAPPFWSLAGRHTPDSLAHAAQSTPSHDRLAMPSLVLTRAEAAAVMAYIDVLARAPRSDWRRLDVPPCIATAHC